MFKLEFEKLEPLCKKDACDKTISEAIETIYHTSDSNIKLFWNSQIVNISWRYDIGDMFLDILKMIDMISTSKENINFSLTWPSSSFMATWSFDITKNNLKITSKWIGVNGGEEKLNKLKSVSNLIILNKEEFISYWVCLVKAVQKDLKFAGYDYQRLLEGRG